MTRSGEMGCTGSATTAPTDDGHALIHAVGDSHAEFSFAGIPGVVTHHIGPVTLKRVGYTEDELLPSAVAALRLTSADALILCFGEIDVRCYVAPQIEHRSVTPYGLLCEWTGRYLDRVAGMMCINGARVVVMGVTPPATRERAFNAALPVTGTDEERADWTAIMNQWLKTGALWRRMSYLDAHTDYADERGMLRLELSDGGVHIKDTSHIRRALAAMGLPC